MFAKLALVSTLAGLAAAAPISTEAHHNEVFGDFSVSFWYDGSYTGSCGYTNSTKQYIASIRNANATLDSACGKTINITDVDAGTSVLAMVVDEVVDAPKHYLNVSRVTFQDVTTLEQELFNATYVFVDAPVPQWTAPKEEDDNKDEVAPAYTPKKEHASPSSSSKATPKAQAVATPASSPKPKQQQQEQKPTSSSKKVEQAKSTPKTTSSSKKAEYTPKTTSSSKKAEYTPKTTSSSKKVEYIPKTTSKKAAQTPSNSGGGGGQFSGRGTWFTQNGNAGACGAVNSDSSYIVAVNSAQYAGGSHCGQSVRISSGGRSITARVADLCPGCPYGGLDLSTGAFQALGSLGQGVLPLSWSWA